MTKQKVISYNAVVCIALLKASARGESITFPQLSKLFSQFRGKDLVQKVDLKLLGADDYYSEDVNTFISWWANLGCVSCEKGEIVKLTESGYRGCLDILAEEFANAPDLFAVLIPLLGLEVKDILYAFTAGKFSEDNYASRRPLVAK